MQSKETRHADRDEIILRAEATAMFYVSIDVAVT